MTVLPGSITQGWTVDRSLVHVGAGVKRDVFMICGPGGEGIAEVFERDDAAEIAANMAAAPVLFRALHALVALMDRDAKANDANHAVIVLDEPEVAAARAALLMAGGAS